MDRREKVCWRRCIHAAQRQGEHLGVGRDMAAELFEQRRAHPAEHFLMGAEAGRGVFQAGIVERGSGHCETPVGAAASTNWRLPGRWNEVSMCARKLRKCTPSGPALKP